MQRQFQQEEVKFGGAAMSLSADLSCLQSSGGAEREAALASLEKQLICPICLEIFNKPVVILPCQHNLCRKCANELYQPSLFQARTTMMVNSGRFRCPSCRHDVVLDRHGVYGLQRNLLVENIIDVYKQEVSNTIATSPLPPPPPLATAQVTCPDHEGEKVNIYCLTCQLPTCSLCKVFGAHQTCQVAPLTDIYQQQKDKLSEGISSLVAFNDKVQALIDQVEETCRTVEENCRTQKQIICDKFDHIFSILEERRKVMTQRISSEQDEKTGHIQALVRCYGDSVDANSKVVESATSSMEEPDMAAFVQNSRELITKVVAATTSCPSETLKPGYENLSLYRFNFSRQERALNSIDFIKAVEDVPEEPEESPEPEEPKEPLIQDIEPKQYQETSMQNLESVVEPVRELIPPVMSAPVGPATPALIQLTPGLMRNSVEPAGEATQLETDDPNDGRSGQIKVEKQEEKVEVERCAAPALLKDRNICEHQEGMSTQQCEGGERQTVEAMQMKEGMDAVFYPSWYTPGCWNRASPALSAPEETQLTEQKMGLPQPPGDPFWEAEPELEPEDRVQVIPEPLIQPPWIQDSQLLSECQVQDQQQNRFDPEQPPQGSELFPNLHPQQPPLSNQFHAESYILQSQPSQHPESQSHPLLDGSPCELLKMPAFIPLHDLQITHQTAGEADTTEHQHEEEEGMQDWVCLPGAGKGLGAGSFDLGGDGSSDSDGCTSSIPLEDTRGFSDVDNYKLIKKKERSEDILAPKGASELKGRALSEAEMTNEGFDERSEALVNDLSELEKDAVAIGEDSLKDDSLDVGDDDGKPTNNVRFKAGSSGVTGVKNAAGENSRKNDNFNPNVETSVAETEEKITSCVSLQAVTLLFYLLAFLVILQRVWAYIGCFICT